MIYVLLGLILLCGLLFSALVVSGVRAEDRLDRVLTAHANERSKLLDRIQFPATRQVEPGPVVEYDPPRDAGELAQVGQIVPNYIDVGENGDANA